MLGCRAISQCSNAVGVCVPGDVATRAEGMRCGRRQRVRCEEGQVGSRSSSSGKLLLPGSAGNRGRPEARRAPQSARHLLTSIRADSVAGLAPAEGPRIVLLTEAGSRSRLMPAPFQCHRLESQSLGGGSTHLQQRFPDKRSVGLRTSPLVWGRMLRSRAWIKDPPHNMYVPARYSCR